MLPAPAPAAHHVPVPRSTTAGQSPGLTLAIHRVGKLLTVTASVAPGAQGHLVVSEAGSGGLGHWAPVGSTEQFTGVGPGSWTLTVSFDGSEGWATQTLVRRVHA